MSKSRHDRRGRTHSDKRCPESAAGGCVYCHTGEYKRGARRAQRRTQRREIAAQRQEG